MQLKHYEESHAEAQIMLDKIDAMTPREAFDFGRQECKRTEFDAGSFWPGVFMGAFFGFFAGLFAAVVGTH